MPSLAICTSIDPSPMPWSTPTHGKARCIEGGILQHLALVWESRAEEVLHVNTSALVAPVGASVGLAVFLAASGAVSGAALKAEIKPYRGAPRLFVNGQPSPGLMGTTTASGDVLMGEGRCEADSCESVKTTTARQFTGHLVAEVRVTFLESRSDGIDGREVIRERVLQPGRTALWIYALALFGREGD
jgi:hypothetical protein